jgi:hypothetical protein
MNGSNVLDVSSLPRYAFGARSLPIWAGWGAIAAELTLESVLFFVYFYFRDRADVWPPEAIGAGPTIAASVATLAAVLALLPMQVASRAASAHDLARVKTSLVVATVILLGFEVALFTTLVRLDFTIRDHAYGSVVIALCSFIGTQALAALVWTALGAIRIHVRRTAEELMDVHASTHHVWALVFVWMTAYAILFFDAARA